MKTIRVLLLMAVMAGVAGCKQDVPIVRKEAAFDAQCDAKCFEKCDEPMVEISTDPETAVISKKAEHRFRQKCELRKDACTECLIRARDAGKIK